MSPRVSFNHEWKKNARENVKTNIIWFSQWWFDSGLKWTLKEEVAPTVSYLIIIRIPLLKYMVTKYQVFFPTSQLKFPFCSQYTWPVSIGNDWPNLRHVQLVREECVLGQLSDIVEMSSSLCAPEQILINQRFVDSRSLEWLSKLWSWNSVNPKMPNRSIS